MVRLADQTPHAGMDNRAEGVGFQSLEKGVGVGATLEAKQRTEKDGGEEGKSCEKEVFSWRRKRFEGERIRHCRESSLGTVCSDRHILPRLSSALCSTAVAASAEQTYSSSVRLTYYRGFLRSVIHDRGVSAQYTPNIPHSCRPSKLRSYRDVTREHIGY